MSTDDIPGPVAPVPVGSVPDGKIVDFLTGKFFDDTPEEYVRQNIEKALVRQYRYKPEDCEPEFSIKMGSSRKRVDIIVFGAGTEHKQENAYVLVECKKPGTSPNDRKEGVAQLQSYMAACVNAQFGLWTNGDDRLCYAKRVKEGVAVFDEIVDIPRAGETEEEASRPKRKDLMPATADNLLFAFRRCHNYIAGSEGMHKDEAFLELLKMIFAKIEDERSGVLQFYVTSSERASASAGGPTKARIQKIFDDKVVKKYPQIFSGVDKTINLKPNVVAYIVSQLQRFSLLASPVDVKGIAYEEIVGSNLRGDRGEFFTPRNACRMAVRMVDPKPSDRLLDPSCGTGGFLITGMNHALEHIERDERAQWADPDSPTDAERQELYRKRSEFLSNNVFGFDLNPVLVRAAKMNMVMNNDGEGGLFQQDSLSHPHTWSPDASSRVPLGSVDVIFTNPPFGANIVIDDLQVLEQYELAAIWDKDEHGNWSIRTDSKGRRVYQKSLPPEILFIERCVQLLADGTGRMAMVIPNGILNNPALEYIRYWLLRHTQILAVVDMHRDLFQPKNDTQTSMVVLRKLSWDERAAAEAHGLDYPVFMAIAEKIGHNKRGATIYRQSETGEDLMVERTDEVVEIDPETGAEKTSEVVVRDRVVDDELPEVAEAYLRWVREVSK